ncbi:hypothetical protein BDV23DRAFT_153184 [Aspergillus alliaceus]|uniref:Alpha-ketoglutarate-dependent dioxygenase AlkB-like domain-containing protein n=1 Tax=Petromyces alliaceus TaxID=209559 RepID=A0A5N7CD49_PETAA|nr:hypothetical protein BDV23DRAFT_153184 [Aspergillus alliaceus]
MVVMRGETQGNWLHSIPKRKGESVEWGGLMLRFGGRWFLGGRRIIIGIMLGRGPFGGGERRLGGWSVLMERAE